MKDYDTSIYQPIKLFGIVLLILSVTGIIFFAYIFIEQGEQEFIWFVTIVSLYYILIVIGILRKTVWGYYIFKSLLYLMLPTLPMGIVSYKYLKYIKKNDLKTHFVNFI